MKMPVSKEKLKNVPGSWFFVEITGNEERRTKDKSGVTLIGIIAAIVFMGLLGAGVLMLAGVGSMGSLQALNQSQAYFAAESGVSAVRNSMRTSAVLTVTGMVGQATFSAELTNGLIISIGRQAEAQWTSMWKLDGAERDALVVYHEKNAYDPCYRTWSSGSGLSTNELNALSNPQNRNIQWQRIVANPQTNEYLMAVQDDGPWISAQAYTYASGGGAEGAWCSNTWLNDTGAAPAANARGFDLAYENLSGRGMVVYSVGTANPQYRTWNSNGWSSPMGMNVGATNPVQWIRLVARPGSDEIMCLARWSKTQNPKGNYGSAIVWNGSTWSNYTPLERRCASMIAYESMDAAWSSNGALVVYINGATAGAQQAPKYRTYTAAGWSAEQTMATLNAIPYWIRVEYSADGTQAYACFLKLGMALNGAFWDGSGWGAYHTFLGATIETVSRRCYDIAWSSQTNTLMVAYCRQNQNAHSYMIATGGGSATNYGTMESTDDGQWSVLRADPFSSAFYYLALDDKNDVNLQRWDGASWTNDPELEANSEMNYLSIDMAFGRSP